METNCPGQGVDDLGVRHRRRYDMAHVDLEEVQFPENIHVGQVTNLNEDEEDERYEEEKRGEDGEALAVLRGGLEVASRYCTHGRAGKGCSDGRDLCDCCRGVRRGGVPDGVVNRTGHWEVSKRKETATRAGELLQKRLSIRKQRRWRREREVGSHLSRPNGRDFFPEEIYAIGKEGSG